MSGVAERLARVQERIAAACARAGRPVSEVTLVAVSKFQPVEAIREAWGAGQRVFGENYAQELRDKKEQLADLAGLELHFIGTLQKNKARYVAAAATMFEALDDLDIARELDKRARALGRTLPVLVEVNFGEEQKGGVKPEALAAFLAALAPLAGTPVKGLMCIPPAVDDPERSRPLFSRLRALGEEHRLPLLSMGMSQDFEVAIEEGATHVRVGTAIFGERKRS